MANIMLAASSFIQELLYISKDIVWKDEYTAIQEEPAEELLYIDMYMAAMKGMLNFTSILSFDADVLIQAGLSEEVAKLCSEDKNMIPYEYRDAAVRIQGEKIINDYEEPNNYYRMLAGLPDKGDTDFVYNTKYPEISDSTTPIHLLSITKIYNLEGNGYIDELCKKYPDKKYLAHLGKKKIEPYYARIANRFSILYSNQSEFTKINNDFKDTYNSCRYAMVRSMYTPERRKENPLYDNVIAMIILFMTIQQMQAKYLDADISRDFYDYESLKYVYDSYGVPFYPTIPLQYHTKIIKNMNILMSYKGSTTVLFKLFNIFNFGNMDIYDFYIMKTHKFENGKPVFKYNEDGTEDKRAMYELKFAQVKLYDNPPLELSDPANHIDYNSMTMMDPYWITNDELLDKLYDAEFNYMESKYIGIRTVFDLMNIAYESAYFFKMIIDNRKNLEPVSVYYTPLNATFDLFTMIIYTCALICKRYGYEGSLSGDAPYVAKVMGYNFKADLAIIREDILNNPYISDDKVLVETLLNMNVNSIASVNSVMEKVESLHALISSRKCSAKTKEAFQAYSELEKTLLTSTYAKEVFRKSDKTQASSFSDLLGDLNAELYIRYAELIVSDVETEAIDTEIEMVLVLLSQSISSLNYIEMCATGSSNIMLEHLFKLLDFFKSAKAELTGYAISYTMSKRGESIMKYFLDAHRGKIYGDLRSDIEEIIDEIKLLHLERRQDYYIQFTDLLGDPVIIYNLESILPLVDKIHLLKMVVYKYCTNLHLHDLLKQVDLSFKVKDAINFEDKYDIIYEKIVYEGLEYLINDAFASLSDSIEKTSIKNITINKSDINFTDNMRQISDHLTLEDKVRLVCDALLKESIKHLIFKEPMALHDHLLSKTYKTIGIASELNLKDDLTYNPSYIGLKDSFSSICDMMLKESIEYCDRYVDTILGETKINSELNVYEKVKNSVSFTDKLTLISETVITE